MLLDSNAPWGVSLMYERKNFILYRGGWFYRDIQGGGRNRVRGSSCADEDCPQRPGGPHGAHRSECAGTGCAGCASRSSSPPAAAAPVAPQAPVAVPTNPNSNLNNTNIVQTPNQFANAANRGNYRAITNRATVSGSFTNSGVLANGTNNVLNK